jgi:hypothetical protein
VRAPFAPFAVALCAGALALGALPAAAVEAAGGGGATPAPTSPPPPPSPAECGPVGTQQGEVVGRIVDPAIALHAAQPVYAMSTALVYPASVDPANTYYQAVVNAIAAAKRTSVTSGGTAAAVATFGATQAALTAALTTVGTQAVQAQIDPYGDFACKGLQPNAPIKMIATEFFTTATGTNVTKYYQGIGLAVAKGRVPYTLLRPIGSIPAGY